MATSCQFLHQLYLLLITTYVFSMYRLNGHRENWHWATLFLACSPIFYGCKEKYLPVVKEVNINYLVVEGFINTGADSTIFNLTRTYKLDNKATVAPEKGAIVAIESDAGASYLLPELPSKPGVYGVPPLNLDQRKKYRLRIRSKDNRTYLSDFVESKTTQPIDNLTYDFNDNNLNVYTNTHDASGKSVYYRYNYVETWEYTAPFFSVLKVENHVLKERDVNIPGDYIYYCWHNRPSTEIVLGTTTALTEDRLEKYRIINLSSTSPKLKNGYSVLVKQTALTREAFEFFLHSFD